MLVGSSAACVGDGQDPDPDIVLTTSGNDGSGEHATDGGSNDGLDETGGGPSLTNTCLTESDPDRFGLKYQCEGSVAIDVLVEGNFDGSPLWDELVLDFGHGVDGDGYEHPHVMACCPAYDFDAQNCDQGHEQACFADLVEQGCKSMETNLRDFASDQFGGGGIINAAKRAAVHKIADHVRDHQEDCLKRFIYDTGIGMTGSTCDAEGNSVPYEEMLESGVWAFDPDGLVDNVEISVRTADWTGLYPKDGTEQQCSSADDNDGVLFLEIDPAPESMLLHMLAGSAALRGPSLDGGRVEGFAELGAEARGCQAGQCSTMAIAIDPTVGVASLENLEMFAASAAEVGTAEAAMTVDDFRILLWDSTPATLDREGQTLTIPAGRAWFAVSAAAGGVVGVVAATNATEIVITRVRDQWASSTFTLAYQDGAGEPWALVIMPAQWQ